MVQCRACEQWFKSDDTWSNHRLYYCIYFKKKRVRKDWYCKDADLDLLVKYLNS